ncbi:ATP-binding protein [Desulfopila sp. IMCC35008]|uniref:ATP-binding protein n=1 Tax=Desulfopila sp. IMCC35008 TaxID=2653858 RepID=UPI0013D3FD79|nr:ATP-binding protein [Desulfopila sp. IMCC35008]
MSTIRRKDSVTDNNLTSFQYLSRLHIGLAAFVLLLAGFRYAGTGNWQLLPLISVIGLFVIIQVYALRFVAESGSILTAIRIVVSGLLPCLLSTPFLFDNIFPTCLLFLVAVPVFITTTGQVKQLPYALLFSFAILAVTILIDLIFPWQHLRLQINSTRIWSLTILLTLVYLFFSVALPLMLWKRGIARKRFKINLATQYSLVITLVSATVIALVTLVLIGQIRNARIQQVGQTFQTVAENFGELVGSHLEQQMQKLQLLTQQVPIIRESLITANNQYGNNRELNHQKLQEKNKMWQEPVRNSRFEMTYLNNQATAALSNFRGHNSFHHNILLVDRLGGLVGSLGKKPEKIFFYDEEWWNVTSNLGLGNIFIGDLTIEERTGLPNVRISIAIVDHSTNRVLGMLSSFYYLRTLVEDMERFRPESVEQISLIDADNRLIATTGQDSKQMATVSWFRKEENNTADSGWSLGVDKLNRNVLIGYSSLATAYNVISNPLHRLGWQIVVSGTRQNAMADVDRSTQWALFVGMVAMAVGVLGAIAAAKVISRPLENLTAITAAMSEGNLNTKAIASGPEELVALSTAFNQLTERLHEVIINLRSRTNQLGKAKQEAENATRLKDEFLAKMSHEIRTPLNAILGFANLLEAAIDNPKEKRHAQIIKNSGTDLLVLINDILDLSKIEAGHMVLQSEAVSLRQLFRELQGVFSISAQEKGIDLMVTVQNSVPAYLMIDRVRLRQVLFNLIGNALKFTAQGSVKCIAQVRPSDNSNRINLQIEVHDTGRGIDPNDLEIVFEKFKQDQNTTLGSSEGSGLGLTISKSLIEMMGGEISVKSSIGAGTTFIISLNNIEQADDNGGDRPENIVTPEWQNTHQFRPADILIIDDLDVNLKLITELLDQYEFVVDQAESGERGLDLTRQKQYDLILLDIRMPRMDGFAVLEKLKTEGKNRTTPVVATTASAMKEEIAEIENADFDYYIIRPFGLDDLLQIISIALPHKVIHVEEPLAGKPVQNKTDFFTDSLWICPPQAKDRIEKELTQQWQLIQQKQSIPDIVLFAKNLQQTGTDFGINILIRYGSLLEEYADDFDIYNMERLLTDFRKLLDNRTV